MNGPLVESRSQSDPKCASTSLFSVGSPRMHMSGDAAVRDEVARARRVAAELGSLRVAVLRLLDLAATAAISTSPRSRTPASRSARTAST